MKIVSQGIRHKEGHHYEIPLSFRVDSQWFPGNREQVLSRALWLRKRLLKNEKFYRDYVNFMSSIIAKGFARKVPSHHIAAKTGQVCYIPHHGIYHAKKTNKIRMVFNCSARCGGVSLNDKLLQIDLLVSLQDFKGLSHLWVTLMQCSIKSAYQKANETSFTSFGGLMETYHKTLDKP